MAFPKIPDGLSSYMIEAQRAVNMCLNYLGNHYKKFDNSKPIKETMCIWYPIEVIEKYVAYLKKIENKDGEPVDGIRFYFGAYGDNGDENAGTRNYSHRQTIFALPTISNGSSTKGDHDNHDSIYLDADSGEVRICDPLKGRLNAKNQNAALNRGHAYPPPPEN